MSRELLRKALRAHAGHLSPFLVLGDPTPEISLELARTAVRVGATMLELGIAYGDPCADGPAIQAAGLRALAAGVRTSAALRLLAEIRSACPTVPLNLLVYGNLVHARGFERFCREAEESGASSLLVPDVPFEEGAVLRSASRAAALAHVELIGPRTDPARLVRLGRASDGFVYLVAHQGVTGERAQVDSIAPLVARVREQIRAPICVGFGLSRAEHVRSAFAAGASIAVVGSHLASVIGDALAKRNDVVEAFGAAVGALLPQTNETRELKTK